MQQNKLLQGAGLWVLRYSLHLKIGKTINMYTWMLTVWTGSIIATVVGTPNYWLQLAAQMQSDWLQPFSSAE